MAGTYGWRPAPPGAVDAAVIRQVPDTGYWDHETLRIVCRDCNGWRCADGVRHPIGQGGFYRHRCGGWRGEWCGYRQHG